jgi:YNFM family putative membrane transporter
VSEDAEYIRHGTPEFRRTNLALFSAGFATFALLYCVQPLMPVLSKAFGVSAAQASLSLSLTTGLLAPAMILAGAISEARGRKQMMVASLVASSALTVGCAVMSQWKAFLLMRALCGLTFAGLPAISMAYLSEEVHPSSIGLAMGLMIGGNGLGGMLGRLVTALIADAFGWRAAIGSIGILGLVATAIFWRTLPDSRHFHSRPANLGNMLRTFGQQLREPKLSTLFAIGFLVMGAFVTTYNYVSYHLLDAPYSLSQAAVGFIFVVYLVGIFASAFIGSRADRVGRGRMLMLMTMVMLSGVALMAMRPLPLVVLGIATVTFGFFGGHSVASSWVGLRASSAKAYAAALYLFCYYTGASVAGAFGGVMWDHWRWTGVELFIAIMLLIAFALALSNKNRAATGHA